MYRDTRKLFQNQFLKNGYQLHVKAVQPIRYVQDLSRRYLVKLAHRQVQILLTNSYAIGLIFKCRFRHYKIIFHQSKVSYFHCRTDRQNLLHVCSQCKYISCLLPGLNSNQFNFIQHQISPSMANSAITLGPAALGQSATICHRGALELMTSS